ncbi:contactin-associated protein like 5-3-like [Dendronephthya gigantea]|uniref:contactin-associated protein like 5-3-like n=1 Tax=Dendronephthya gigantea TaxID=151771 RepID=UPI00106C1F56|nr:contactin-associated protein like 5-3-like [Dendronephthya gigantea]
MFSFRMAVLLRICALVFISRILQPGECSVAEAFFRKMDGKYLANHVIETIHAETELECSMHCAAHGSCVSVNFKTSGIGKGRCELNNRTLKDKSEDDESMNEPDFKHLYIIKKIASKPITTNTQHSSQNLSTGILKNFNKSCTSLRTKHPSADSGMYSIKPQGLNLMAQVFCDMTSKNGVGVTEIGHDSESKILVDGYEAPGSYKRKIKYNIFMQQIIAVIDQSKNCEQFIKYECFHSKLLKKSNGLWVSRQGSKMNYWGGAAVDSGKCSCGMTNSCAGGGKCNCDKNDQVWREDSGYLTDKNTLLVTELRFGDTGKRNGVNERGYHTLGKLRCWG